MVDQAESTALGPQDASNTEHELDGFTTPALIWTDSVLTLIVCNLAFIAVVVVKPHYVACLICGWLGWFMIGISIKDGEYSSLLSAWTYLVILGAPMEGTFQFEREVVICCSVVTLPWLPLFVGSSVIDSTEEKMHVFSDVLQLFRIGGSLYIWCYMALLGLMFTVNRFIYWTAKNSDMDIVGVCVVTIVVSTYFSAVPISYKLGTIGSRRRLTLPSLKVILFSIVLASFGTVLSLGIRWASIVGPLSHLVCLESPVYQVIAVLLTLAIEIGTIVSVSQRRIRKYPEQYIYSFQWGLRAKISRVSQWRCLDWLLLKIGGYDNYRSSLSVRQAPKSVQTRCLIRCHPVYDRTSDRIDTTEKCPAGENTNTSGAEKTNMNLLTTISGSLISSLLAILAVAGISMINNDSEAWWQLAGYVGWVGLLYSIIKLRLSSSIIAWVTLIAFGSNCGGESSPQRTMTILIGSPCFLFIVRHFNAKVRDPSGEAPSDLSDVEKVDKSTGTLGVMCIVAIHWFLSLMWIVPLLSTIILEGPKIQIAIFDNLEAWQLDICIFVGAVVASFVLAIATSTKNVKDLEEAFDVPFSLVGATTMQIFTRLIVAPTSYMFIESRVEASFFQVHSVVWTFLMALMFISICGIYNGHALPDMLWVDFIDNPGAVPLCSIRATFGLGWRLKFLPDHRGTRVELDDIDQ